jgi:hypothetical protein
MGNTATLHLHQPIDYTVRDGARFEASRIAVYEQSHPDLHEVRVYGVLVEPGNGPVARILVIHPHQTVDLTKNLSDTVRTLLAAGDYETL